ncbi:MAG: hypothetical protein HQL56_15380 [Magnetococcales bacterium]|nr:hypothetical protein [Magnetococcales bacterium]
MQNSHHIILLLFLAGLSALFGAANQVEVELTIPGGWILPRVPLVELLFLFLFAGYALGLLAGVLSNRKYRRLNDHLLLQNRDLEQEVINLRNLPLEKDLPY